ncbi:pyroglutamyl-peptidase 1-like protein isoform X2 [Dromiciops gliroides]|uniref:pyroglutamyl-peptidase 1-like protein isoform X2 n=1 Tax=Dromiciops gliroides TaxID=33562 RepID=UPI001CC73677|nr:pyroglutamyl-peptidase 1-like protein isoform X2 [Dromiciops gliroides]
MRSHIHEVNRIKRSRGTLQFGSGQNVAVQILQLPVVYKKTKQQVSKIWQTLQPQFTVHVGLASSSKAIILEQCGKNRGYRDADICGFLPEGGICLSDGPDVIESTINMKAVCKNISVNGIQVLFSRDAGRRKGDKVIQKRAFLKKMHRTKKKLQTSGTAL